MGNNLRQQGYAAVLLLSLLSVTLTGLGFVSSFQSVSAQQTLWQDATQLNDERQRLIHYSVDYVNLYGHGSAGPGHLPCPDTDTGGTRPGPNPPCARGSIAKGKLPSGVNRSVGRIVFSSTFSNRSSYSVLRALVNNPALDINSAIWPTNHEFEPFKFGYALLRLPSGLSRTINKKHLKSPTHLWVRAWIVAQLIEEKFGHCEKSPELRANYSHALDASYRIAAVCQSRGEAPPPLIDESLCEVSHSECSLSSMSLLGWLLGNASDEWHGVPIARHWFVDNGWLEMTSFHWDPQCNSSNTVCLLIVSNDPDSLIVRLIAGSSNS